MGRRSTLDSAHSPPCTPHSRYSPPPPFSHLFLARLGPISALIGPESLSRPPSPVGTACRARKGARSYPFSPRSAPSRRPGGGIHASPGGPGSAGPAPGADETRRRRCCALRFGELGLARSARASPDRTRGAFVSRALRSWLRAFGLCSRQAAARAANRVGRRAGIKGPVGEVLLRGLATLKLSPSLQGHSRRRCRLRTGSRSHSGWGRRTAEALFPPVEGARAKSGRSALHYRPPHARADPWGPRGWNPPRGIHSPELTNTLSPHGRCER